ncbi:MFS transporter [Blastococcus atacamensis]|uniref:MFS transporter n=1 Tax=Blastococcus atacamensis TaxID=2070508 RepID=UPI000CEC29D3|nr:MFS transporter [Blastococcus atacamensis]
MSDPTAAGTRPAVLVVALSLGVTTLSLLQSLVVPSLGRIEEQLDISASAAGWVLTANLLAAAVLTPVLGRLGDLRGERPVILGILAAISLGTLLAIVTESLPLLLVARVLQGASYGLFPLSMSVLRRELPKERLSVAMAVVSSTLAVGGVVGLVATGLLTGDDGDYRHAFWVGLAVGLVSLALVAWMLPHHPGTASGRIDWWGALVLGAGLVLLLLPLSQGPSWGWATPGTIGCLVGSVVVLAGWVALQRRTAEPLVRPAMLTDRRTVVPNLAGLMTGIALFASFLAVLAYVQSPPEVTGYGFGAGVLEAAVVYLLPGGIAGIAVAPFAGRLVGRLGALPTLVAGATCGVVGFGLLAGLRGEPWQVVLAGLLTQLSVTVAYAALPALVVQAVREDETGVANAVNSIARSVGQALGSTLAVTSIAASVDPATGLPRAMAFTLVALIGVVASLVVVGIAVAGLRAGPGRGDGAAAGEEAAPPGAGERSPASGLR